MLWIGLHVVVRKVVSACLVALVAVDVVDGVIEAAEPHALGRIAGGEPVVVVVAGVAGRHHSAVRIA